MSSISVKTTAAEKKDVDKLQRAIVDGLEDVKAQDIQIFDTEHITSLFERVIVASGNSNRQTKALAASVRDAVRDAGFAKPRIEGEDNGEWIIVDCGTVVAHIMQPTIRQYYHLEELWGDKPVKKKPGKKPVAPSTEPKPATAVKTAAKTAVKAKAAAPTKIKRAFTDQAAPAAKTPRAAAKKVAKKAVSPAGKVPLVKVPPAKKVAAKKTMARAAAKKTAAKKAAPRSR